MSFLRGYGSHEAKISSMFAVCVLEVKADRLSSYDDICPPDSYHLFHIEYVGTFSLCQAAIPFAHTLDIDTSRASRLARTQFVQARICDVFTSLVELGTAVFATVF